MLPLAVPLVASALSTVPNWILGIKQNKMLQEMRKNLKRPAFEIPEAEKAALGSAKAQAGMTKLPGQDAMEGRIDEVTANKLGTIERGAESSTQMLNASGSAYGQQMDAKNELGEAAANMYLGNQQILRNELHNMGGWENKQWTWDKQMPYEQTAHNIAALTEARDKNFTGGAKDLMGGLANISLAEHLNSKNNEYWGKLLGAKTDAPAATTAATTAAAPVIDPGNVNDVNGLIDPSLNVPAVKPQSTNVFGQGFTPAPQTPGLMSWQPTVQTPPTLMSNYDWTGGVGGYGNNLQPNPATQFTGKSIFESLFR